MKIYAVGGSVRDEMLGLAVKDRDFVVVGCTPQQMIDAGYKPVGADFPVFLHPVTRQEYALARTERKTAPGYTGFQFHTSPDVTLVDDLRRRDLTINAMAKDADGTLIDPYGGKKDLADKLLRHVSEAFAEDPVRILRVARFSARFAALGFRVADETMTLMRTMVASGEVDHLVSERVWQEIARGLMEPTPSAMFKVLHASGALAKILPEISVSLKLPPTKDLTLQALDFAAQQNFNLPIRFTALTHCIGENQSAESAATIIRAMCERVRVPVDCRDLALTFARWLEEMRHALTLNSAQLLALLDGTDALRRPDRFRDLLYVTGCMHPRLRETYQYLRLALAQLQSMNQGEIAAKVMPADIPNAIRAAKLAALEQFILLKEKT